MDGIHLFAKSIKFEAPNDSTARYDQTSVESLVNGKPRRYVYIINRLRPSDQIVLLMPIILKIQIVGILFLYIET